MTYDQDRIEEAVLALLVAFSFDESRAWKGFDFEIMDRLHARGLIDNPKGKAKSVGLTPAGLEAGRRSAERLFSASADSAR